MAVEGGPPPGLVGSQIGQFRVDGLLGRGGMGEVYRAFDVGLERAVALKTILFESEATRRLFLREARAQAKLRHPNVVPIHAIGDHAGSTYLVMELVDGESLAAVLAREKKLSEPRALDVVDDIAAALEAAHAEGLIHRDVKPSNVLVARSGRVLLADFGLAKDIGGEVEADVRGDVGATRGGVSPIQTNGTVGTPAYLAPEQSSGKGAVDHRADIYSLGVTLYEIVTGILPFGGATESRLANAHERAPPIAPRTIARTLRPETEALILRMLAKSPDDRFSTYAELRTAIASARPKPLAGFVMRMMATAIDFTPFVFVAVWLGNKGVAVHDNVMSVAFFGTMLACGLAEGRWAVTLGKRLLNLRIVDDAGKPPSFARAFVRAVLRYGISFLATFVVAAVYRLLTGGARGGDLPGLVPVLSLAAPFTAALGRRRAAIHDRLTRTHVVIGRPA